MNLLLVTSSIPMSLLSMMVLLRVESLGGESPVIHSRRDDTLLDPKQPSTQDSVDSTVTPIINPKELVGHTFLWDKQNDGQQFRSRIVKLIDDHTSQLENNKDRIKILLSLPVKK
jgi:hypothetical protein